MDCKPDGHDEAMRDLIASTLENEADFATWQERFSAKKAAQEAKAAALHESVNKDGSSSMASASCSRSTSTKKSWLLPFGLGEITTLNSMESKKKAAKKNPYNPIRIEIYSPPAELEVEAAKRGLKFTVGKEYPIFAELLEGHRCGVRYITQDDEGNRRSVNSSHFNMDEKLQWADLIEDEWLSLAAKNWHENNNWRVELPIADKTIEVDTSIEQV